MGVVYLVCDPSKDLYKIGMTRSTGSRRLKQLLTGNGTELIWQYGYECEYPYRLESILHRRFSHKKTIGEWFALSTEDVLNFLDTCKLVDENIHCLKDEPYFAKNLK